MRPTVPILRAALRTLAPGDALTCPAPLAARRGDALARQQAATILLSAFALLALVLAAVGVFGVISQVVGERTAEYGVRLALGARRDDILLLVLRGAVAPALVGTLAGIAAAALLGRLLEAAVPGTGDVDPLLAGGVVLVLLSTSVLASWIPARRASRLDPLTSLRGETPR
jgi:putative ABC transport system permease protein